MNVKKTSLILVGMIWFLVGLGLGITGINWLLKLSLGLKMVVFVTTSILLGWLKGKFVLQKVAYKYFKNSNVIEFNKQDIFIGWAKILGVKGFILIGIMIAMGVFLRHSNIDRPILGVIYLAVGIALVYASKIFFSPSKAKTNDSINI